jgi:DNA-binding MarR family transcriptional regulator
MSTHASLVQVHDDTWERYRSNLPRHLMGITRHLQSEAMHSLSSKAGYSGLRLSFEPCMTLIGEQGCRVGELAAWLGSSKQACNQTINQIERAGYVRRTADPGDGRARMLQLTERGRKLVSDGAAAVAQVSAQYEALLGERDFARFGARVERLCGELEYVRPVHRVVRRGGADLLAALLSRLSEYIAQRLMELTVARGHPRLKRSFGQVLGLIGPGGGRMQQIARIQQVSKQAVSAVVAELEELGYIERITDAGDARGQLIRFSAAGRQLLADSVASVDELEREFAAIIGDGALLQLRSMAARLYGQLKLEAEVFHAQSDLDLMARQIRQQLGPQATRELARLLGELAKERRT